MSSTSADQFFLGIDVGTGSARAGLFDRSGTMLAAASSPIQMWRPQTEFAEQSSNEIWEACCQAVRRAMNEAHLRPQQIGGIGFDATCSLVALDPTDAPVTISPTGRDERNVIVWMDHRAIEQEARINESGHDALKYVGSRISPEMQSPKLLWLKENLPDTWRRAGRFFDLSDFLSYRATACDTRSLCTTVCKWTYLGHEKATAKGSVGRWDDSYWEVIGLVELVREGYARIGTHVRPMGDPIGNGLNKRAADELGLLPGVPVGVGIIDAHAGGLGLLGAPTDGAAPREQDMDRRLALIGGTSTCHMAVARQPRFINGVWGPYFGAMVPGLWLTEGGQSATGALIDHAIFSHARAAELKKESASAGRSVCDLLNDRLDKLAAGQRFPAFLTRELHLLPYFHGNRSPRADATLRGMVSGLRLSDSLDDLALIYLATIQAVAYGTRHIIDTLNKAGYCIDTIFACGGGTKNPVFLREHADITGCTIALPKEPEAVLLGSAMLGAVAAGEFESVLDAMSSMNHAGKMIVPGGGEVSTYHAAKHAVFLRMYEDFMAYRKLMG